MNDTNIKLFSGTANPELATRIAANLGGRLGSVQVRRFPDGETFVQYTENIRGADVFIIQPTCGQPNEMLMELLIMLDAARRASPQRITAVLPYFGYARQDRKNAPRAPITAKLVANLLVTAGAERVVTMDLHAHQIQGFFDIPLDHLYASPVLVRYLREAVGADAVIVSPDTGSVKMAHAYGDLLGGDIAIVAKRRVSDVHVESTHLVGDVEGRDCVIVDDLTTTAGTLVKASERLREAGAKRIFAAVSHCCLNETGLAALAASPITELVTTDTVPLRPGSGDASKVRVLSVSRLLGEAIRRIHEGRSVSSLLRLDTNPEINYI